MKNGYNRVYSVKNIINRDGLYVDTLIDCICICYEAIKCMLNAEILTDSVEIMCCYLRM